MKAILKKCLCLLLTAGLLASLAACAGQTDTAVVKDLFGDLQKVSYSSTYTSLKDNKTNKTDSWRQGMVSGNGLQGFVTSGDPYSDTFIFQNMHFLLPNKNARTCPDTANELETVRQQIVKGQDITDNASYDDVYRYHPGGQLRMAQTKAHAKDYVRYTDYATGQVGVRYTDKNGTWLRRSITSMADGVVITRLDPSTTGTALNLTLSYDDLSTLANFGKSEEVDLQYKKVTAQDGSTLGLIAHYPDYKNSERKDGGYATLTYVLPVGGTRERVTLDKQTKESQFVGDNTGVRITGAAGLVLLTVSDYTLEMGKLSDFAEQTEYPLLADLRAQLEKVAARYSTDGAFDYDAALAAHLKVYRPQFDAVTLTLSDENIQPNEALLKAQKGKKEINAALAQRTYYAGRYAALCCAGYSTGRLYGMWTGEWNTGWGSKYTMDANVNLQTAALNSSNMSRGPQGYAYFLLRQMPDWEENARATHGFTDAIQAPVNTDGDKAVLTETCYPYPFRYWNAGASWMLRPLYETLQSYGNIQIPLSDEFNLQVLRSVLSATEKDLTDAQLAAIERRGYLRLEEDILYPLLTKAANYWAQLLTPEYYTSADGSIHYEKGKTALGEGESYCIVPSYSPENNPDNYASPSDANCAIDIAACRDNMEMLLSVMNDVAPGADQSRWKQLKTNLPPYLYDDTGALKEWATTAFNENNEHRHLSHLYCAWPLMETRGNARLTAACKQAVENRKSENEASHALVHRSLIAARLQDRAALTDALVNLMNHKIRYNSLMTNHDYDRGSCYCTDFAIGYLGIVHEALVYSNDDEIELLPALPESGFDRGTLTGLKTRNRATVTRLQWDLAAGTVQAVLTADVDRTLTVRCGQTVRTLHCKAGEPVEVQFTLGD